MTVDQHAFRSVLGRFATGVTVVTAIGARNRVVGITVTAFSSVSLDPPLVSICIDHSASVHNALSKAESFVVNILSEGQEALARRFAETDPNRFEGIGWDRGQTGNAILFDVLGYLECRVVGRHRAGDHDIIIGEVEVAESSEGKPLLYYRGGYAQLER
ncbi:MAG TPA: flavin reductase family protein [Gemmatimonadaceae bacterium]|nr:flavin reductase family protein [Gemmatimonadaceae bacterium]